MLNFKIGFNRSLLCSLLPLTLGYSLPVVAGYDPVCTPNFNLQDSRSFDQCSNLPVFIPGNDNKTNMMLLLSDLGLAKIVAPQSGEDADKYLWSASYAQVPFESDNILLRASNRIANQRQANIKSEDSIYEERCISLNSAAKQFNAQVQNHAQITASEKQALIQARDHIQSCDEKNAFLVVDPSWSKTTQQYASYLNASIAFYNANFSTATKIYSVLTQVDDAWLKETAQYMLIRSSLNSAFATAVDTYGDVQFEKVNPVQIKQVQDNIRSYLKLYPQGQYLASAQGLLRRVYWLSGRQDLLINEIVWQMHNPKSARYNLEVAQLPAEIDRRIFQNSHFDAKNLNDPFFLATYDLMQMRDSSDPEFKPLTWTALNAQKAQFKDQPELFKYLQASHLFYVQHKPAEAQRYLPSGTQSLSDYLKLSQAFLNGLIIEKTSPNQAQAYWAQLLSQSQNVEQRGLFEVALAKHLNTQQQYQAYIGKNAQIAQINLQREFMQHIANEQSLEKIIQSKDATTEQKQTALFVLLAKSLGHQNYSLFNRYYPQLPQDAAKYQDWQSKSEQYKYQPPFAHLIWNGNKISAQLSCPDLKNLAQSLEKSPQDLNLKMCLGEYMRSEHAYSVLQQLSFDQETPVTFQGKVFTRGQAYKDIINRKQKSELTAYALYRSIQCYAPSGMNDCQDSEVAKSTRKQWFDQLKRDYPETSWAKSLKYYW